jgi:hypothetical protein
MFSFGVRGINKSHLLTTASALKYRKMTDTTARMCLKERSLLSSCFGENEGREETKRAFLFNTSLLNTILSDSWEESDSVLRAMVST